MAMTLGIGKPMCQSPGDHHSALAANEYLATVIEEADNRRAQRFTSDDLAEWLPGKPLRYHQKMLSRLAKDRFLGAVKSPRLIRAGF